MPADYLDQLAEFVCSIRLEDLADSTVTAARAVVLDTIGAITAGSRLPENANFARLAAGIGGPGKTTIVGHNRKVQPLWATMVNATAGVALEMDEGSRLGGGHPSIHITPGAIAVGEDLGKSGQQVLESIIVGYEVTSRIGSATQIRPEIHSHGTWGTIGAAAATSRLLGFNPAQTGLAMNLAMSMSPANTWTPCIEGATVRNLYPGRSGFQGIMAAYLSTCGYTGVADGPADLYTNILGEGFDSNAVVDGLGTPGEFRIERNYFKLHACCLYNHPVLDAVQNVMREDAFTGDQVERIRVAAPPIVQIMTNPEPPNMLAAKFSIPYAVAVAVHSGITDVTAFYPDRVSDTAIRELASRVEVVSDDEMSLRRYDYPSARVAVHLKDQRILEGEVTSQHGDFSNPPTRDELLAKFQFLAGETLGEQRTQQVINTVARLDAVDDISELTGLLSGPD
jgi:2-methylcitrate dehydratase PrpD